MRRSNLQTSRLLLEPTPRNATLEIFISTPTLSEEYALGKLFGIIHIESTKDEAYEIAITIRRETERRYYQGFNLKNDISVEKKFEEALAQLNQTIAELIDKNQIHLKLEQIHFVLGVIHKKNLHFTQFGNIKAYLIHKIKGKDYRPINILESTEGTKPQTSLVKLFSNIISGEIGSNDALFFSTETVTDYLSLDKLIRTIIYNSASEANAHLATLLKEIDSKISFGALILKYPSLSTLITNKQKTTKTNIISVIPERSIVDLAHTESKTEEILSPRPTNNLKKQLKDTIAHIKNVIEKTNAKKKKKKFANNVGAQTNIYQRLTRKKTRLRSPSHIVRRFFQRRKSAWGDMVNVTVSLFGILFPSKKKENKSDQLVERISSKPGRMKKNRSFFSSIPKKIQIIGTMVLLLVMILIVSSFFVGNNEAKKEINAQFMAQIQKVKNQINKADAALIYGDDASAKAILIETEALLKTIRTTSSEQELQKKQEQIRLNTILNQMRKIENILDPEIIAMFRKNMTPGQINSEYFLSLVQSKNAFVVLSNKEIYYYNDAKGKTTLLSAESDVIFSDLMIADDKIFVISNTNKVFELDPTKKTLTEYSLGTEAALLHITDAVIYANRLYVLDNLNRQILRMPQSGQTFSAPQFWLKGESDSISKATSFAIDGTIFVLFSDATIGQYSLGNLQTNFIIPADPILKNPSKIFTSRDTDFLYILDPDSKRLVVLTKTGKLIRQFTSKKFDQLEDFVVNEKEKKIYLLNKDTIYSITASHLSE